MISTITVDSRICPMRAPSSESDSVPLCRGAEARRVGTYYVQRH